MMSSNQQRGFTLVELIISVALFASISTIAAAAYLNLINLERRTRANADMVNNLAFAVDAMSRTIRTGSGYQCATNTCAQFTFVDAAGCTITYRFFSSTIQQVGQDVSGCTDTTTIIPLIDSRIIISNLSFHTTGLAAGTGDYTQPMVTITISGSIPTGVRLPSTSFIIDTAATSRIIDI